MAENLNYQTDNSWCYGDVPGNCEKYGRLYAWDDAMNACPDGWRLPSRKEWDKLVAFAGGAEEGGTKLKSKSPDWDGDDDYGFSALPGGLGSPAHGSFGYLGNAGFWWTAAEYGPMNPDKAYHRQMGPVGGSAGESYDRKNIGFSVRCVQDKPKTAQDAWEEVKTAVGDASAMTPFVGKWTVICSEEEEEKAAEAGVSEYCRGAAFMEFMADGSCKNFSEDETLDYTVKGDILSFFIKGTPAEGEPYSQLKFKHQGDTLIVIEKERDTMKMLRIKD
jgi:uncharacterized protein (TIGR02145 family)